MGEDSLTRTRVKEIGESARNFWLSHFLLCLVAVGLGMIFNEGRKLVSAKPDLGGEECVKTYINVMASALGDEGSTICCPGGNAVLCSQNYLPGAKALSRLPGAQVIPLIPAFLRGAELLAHTLFGTTRPVESWQTYASRIGFYWAMFFFRGYVLYKGFNVIQAQFVSEPTECWFSDLVKGEPACHGVDFDFSDHTVLYLGSILPIPLFEIVHSLHTPLSQDSISVNIHRLVLVGGMIYLYVIALGEEFKTAAYYHTRMEIFVGFLVSLLVQVPMAFLQCSTAWSRARRLLLGFPDSSVHHE